MLKSTRKFTWLLLIGFVLQNAFTVLVGRYTRSGGNAHEIHHMLLVTEILKFGLSCGMEYINSNGKVYQSIKIHVIDKPWDCAKIGFPALLYYGQNYAISASFAFMSVLLFQMIFQWKLLATVVLSTFLLKRQYKVQQLICMVVLCIGVSILAMYDNDTMASLSSPLSSAMLVLYACLCSSVAGVYFEKILKENTGQEVSVWMRNMQLAWFSILISTAHALISSSPKPLLYGFTYWVWLQIFLLGIGGLLVAVVLKYTSAVTKGLATNISIVISVFVASVIWGSRLLTFDFAVASAMVLTGVYVFNNPTQTRRFVLALAVWLVIRLINFEETIAIETDLLLSVEMHPLNDCNGTSSDCTLIYPDDWTLPDYHERPVLPVLDLRPMFPAMFGLDYKPSLHRRSVDGHPFLLLLMVQQPEWLGMAINFILSLGKLGIYNVTITSRDNDVLEAANALGLITFNSTEVSKQMPKWFKPLPSWTWGVDMWQRYVTSWHAIRQGIGTCHFDVDTAVSTDIFFDPPGGPYDITMQGHLLDPRMRPVPLKPEKYLKRCNFQYRILGSANYEKFYVNQGYACYAANERTFEFFSCLG